jgi:hypothetical protein
MDLSTIGLATAKILGGILGNRAAKRQAQNQQLQASIGSNFVRSNLLRSATQAYGHAAVAANRAGGFSHGTFAPSFSNLAGDLRQLAYNQDAQDQLALATASVGRMSLLNSAVGAWGTLSSDPWAPFGRWWYR